MDPRGAPVTAPGTVRWVAGDVAALPFADGTFDVVTARFVLQHLRDPAGAARALVRMARPGGVVCVVDADDALSFSHPEPPEAVRRLVQAYGAAQRARGGDRTVGRKLAGLLDAAGAEITAVLVLPQAAYGTIRPDAVGQRLLAERLSAVADEITGLGLLTRHEVDEGLRVLTTETQGPATVFDGHVAVLGRRRGDLRGSGAVGSI
jgi:SAM-dependent methyltransferase